MRSGHSAPWRVIYIARGEAQARQIEELLGAAGFLCEWKRPATGAHAEDIEIKALEAEAKEAQLYLMEQGM